MNAIQERRSIRKYLDKKIPNDVLLAILESARLAPSGSNTQPWRFLVVEDYTTKQRIVAADHQQEWMMSAPIFIVCAADLHCRTEKIEQDTLSENSNNPDVKLIIRDTAIAVEHILLEAQNQEIGSCWTAWFEQKDMKTAVNAPAGYYISAVVTLGYAAEQPAPRPRKPLNTLVSFGSWQD